MKKIALIIALNIATFSLQAADINQLIEMASTPVSAKEQSEMVEENLNTMLAKSDSGDKAAYAERQRFFARLPEVTKQLSNLSDEEKEDSSVMENLQTIAQNLKAAEASGMASDSEKALISSLAKKQEAVAEVIEANVKKKEEEEEKAKAVASATNVIRMSAPVGSQAAQPVTRFYRAPVSRFAGRGVR